MQRKFERLDGVISRRRGAFTMVELLVVVAIMAILAGLVFGAMMGMGESAKRKKTKTQIATVELGLEMFRLEYGSFPVSEADPESDPESGARVLYQALSGDGNDQLQLTGDPVPSLGELASSQRKFIDEVDPKSNPFAMVLQQTANNIYLIDPWRVAYRYICYESLENRRQNQRNPASYDLYSHSLTEDEEIVEGKLEEKWITNWD